MAIALTISALSSLLLYFATGAVLLGFGCGEGCDEMGTMLVLLPLLIPFVFSSYGIWRKIISKPVPRSVPITTGIIGFLLIGIGCILFYVDPGDFEITGWVIPFGFVIAFPFFHSVFLDIPKVEYIWRVFV